MNQVSKIILSIVVIILFYSILVIYSDVSKINQNFSKIQINHVIPIIGIYIIAIFVGGLRQKFLLNKLGLKINIIDNFLIFIAGLSMIITPAGSGLLIKTYYMKKKLGYQLSKTFPLVVIERFSDLIVVSSLLLVSLFMYFSEITLIVSIISFSVLGIFVFSIANKRSFNILKFFLGKIPIISLKLEEANEFDTNIINLLKFRTISTSLIITTVGVLLESLVVYFAFNTFNIELPYLETTQIFYTSIVGGILSLIPGGVGITESSFVSLLTQKNIPIDLATSLIIFIRMTTIWFATMLGVIFSIFILKNKSNK